MTIEKLEPAYNFTKDKLEQLKQVIPEAFGDGKINFDILKNILSDNLEENSEKENFGLFWTGKTQSRKVASTPSKGTLVPVKGEGIDEENTKNVFIEGDNLEVLKLLQKSYAGKIKMIYIDPPYNTGSDFVYEDDFSEPIKEYLKRTGQVDEQGKELTTNKKSDGRFHAKWLSMMYPRLSLARNLLKDDGVIFISIDDNEVHNLRLLCNEIFGEENFVGNIVRSTGQTTGQDSGGLGSSFDYLLVYSKESVFLSGLPLNEKDLKRFENQDEKGKYSYDQMRKTGGEDRREDRPSMYYPVINPDGNEVFPIGPGGYESRWRFEKKTYEKLVSENMILWKKTKKEDKEVWWPYVKYYLEGRTKRPSPLWDDLEGNKKASRDLREIFDGKKIFDFPKPIELLKRIIQIIPEPDKNDIILDFFAGSGTTAHAVLDLNKEDSCNRKFICVQMPEKTSEDSEAFKADYKNISEITKERIRRVIKKIKSENEGKLDFNENTQDLGFKVFKLTPSNYKEWKDFQGNDINQLELAFSEFNNPLVDGWKEDDLLTEIIIIEGFPLQSKVQILNEYQENKIQEVTSEFCEHKLLVCLDQKIQENTITELKLDENDIFICLDSAVDDPIKLRLSDKGLIKTI